MYRMKASDKSVMGIADFLLEKIKSADKFTSALY